jgi:hypothetical protein
MLISPRCGIERTDFCGERNPPAFLLDLFLALIVGFGLTTVGAAFRQHREGKPSLKY